MTGAISAILPSIVSGATFSTRRTNRGMDSNNIFEGSTNCAIAGGQSYKALECSKELAKNLQNSKVGSKLLSAHEYIREISKDDQILKGLGKGLRFVGDYVNQFITAAEAIRVLCADDKESALLESGFALGTMFTFEKHAKKFLGISKFKRVNGVNTAIPQEALYKEVKCVKEGIEKFVDYCSKTKVFGHSIEHLPSVMRGLGFVGASIAGYKLGAYVGNKIAKTVKGDKESTSTTVQQNTTLTTPTLQQNQTAQTIAMYPELMSYTNVRKSA